jgi:hypothetical protein
MLTILGFFLLTPRNCLKMTPLCRLVSRWKISYRQKDEIVDIFLYHSFGQIVEEIWKQ